MCACSPAASTCIALLGGSCGCDRSLLWGPRFDLIVIEEIDTFNCSRLRERFMRHEKVCCCVVGVLLRGLAAEGAPQVGQSWRWMEAAPALRHRRDVSGVSTAR